VTAQCYCWASQARFAGPNSWRTTFADLEETEDGQFAFGELLRHLPFAPFIRHLNPYRRKIVIISRSKVRVPVAYHCLVIASVRKQRCRRRGRNPACRGTSCKKTLGSGQKPSLLFDFLDFRILYSDAHDATHIISY
jgi:hypothetical protein